MRPPTDVSAAAGAPHLSSPPPDPRAAWRILAVLALAELLGMSLWFTASATSAQLRDLWGLSVSQAGWLTTSVQLGFVAGTALAAVLNLADLIPDRRYFAGCALLSAGANAALVLAPGYEFALASRFLTGMFLAGVYPPAMKMVATWWRERRGFAIGALVGALTFGKALPYLVSALRTVDYRGVALSTSSGAVLAALLVGAAYRPGPFAFERRPFSWGLVGAVLRHRPTRLAIGGYLGHMWELYAMWAAVGLFFFDYFSARGALLAATLAGLTSFGAIAAGALGSVVAGVWADRFGRENVASAAMAISGSCALVIGWVGNAPAWLLILLALVWGATIVADSAQFSSLVTEVSPRHAVGTALTIQTSLGFALTAASIWLTIELASGYGWGPAFSMLAVGPCLGIWQMMRLRTLRRAADGGHTARAG